jgi:dihydrofolate reductase
MGRKTWESLGKPLPGRIHIVITRQKDFKAPGATVVNSLEEALVMSSGDQEVFIFGGGEIFAKALPVVQKIYLTRVHAKIHGDTFFPKFDLMDWKIVSIEDHRKDEKNDFDYSFITMERLIP